jgi:tetratricopeptide (TPR) repeat protein
LVLLAGLIASAKPGWAVPKGNTKVNFRLLLAARAARRAGDYDKAKKILEQYENAGVISTEWKLERALLQAQQGDVNGVERFLRSFLDKKKHQSAHILVLEALTYGYLNNHRVAEAQQCLEDWLKHQPKDVQAWLLRGRLHILSQSSDSQWSEPPACPRETLQDYQHAVEIEPKDVQARLRLGEALVHWNEPTEAITQFEIVLRQKPNHPAALVGLARCRRSLGEQMVAQEILTRLLKKNPHQAGALLEQGKLALQKGNATEAEKWLRRSLAREPNDLSAVYILYLCLKKNGKGAEAKQVRARHKRIRDDQHRLHRILGRVLKRPKDARLRSEAGRICLRNGRTEEGLGWLKGALWADPDHKPTHRALADYYERSGDKELAQRHRRLAKE